MNLELMAPAGNVDSFLSALENGADSVYLGLKKFNARRPAGNFTFYQFKKAIEFAHSLNKKVYLALNIDLKSNELHDAVEYIEFSSLNKIDGIIIKDPALLYILKNFYSIDIHFSTQNAIESSPGVEFAKLQGIKRIVLARELELSEIIECAKINGIDIEIFTEGSMCFCISGRCLMSSWVGGRSGNRGCCTAPCRIMWRTGNIEKNIFSMKDLNLITELCRIKESKVAALKIEGRLKNANWVGAITRIYRKALLPSEKTHIADNDKLVILRDELKKYSAREKSTGHIDRHDNLIGSNSEWNDFEKSSNEYSSINKIVFEEKNEIIIHSENGNITVKIIINETEKEFNYKIPQEPKKGRSVSILDIMQGLSEVEISGRKFVLKININEFHTSSSFINKLNAEIQKEAGIIIRNVDSFVRLNPEILDFISQVKQDVKRDKLLGEHPDKILISPDQVDDFIEKRIDISTIVISAIKGLDLSKIKKLKDKYKVIISIPPVLFQKDIKKISMQINDCCKNGFNNFEANSFTGIQLLQGIDADKYLGIDMSVYNHVSAMYYHDLGFKSVYCPSEGDISMYKAITAFSKTGVDVLVFGRIPLFISRVNSPEFKDGKTYKDKYCVVECYKQNDLNLFVDKTPFSLLGNNFKKEKIYFNSLTCDLRFFNNPFTVLHNIFENKKFDSSDFNFYRKLV